MNLKTLLYCLALIFVALSCKDDEEEVTAPIVGKWQGDKSEVKANYGLISLYDETDEEFDVQLDFKKDGTVSYTRDGQVTTGTYTVTGDKLTTNVDLQIYDSAGDTTFDIEELSDNRLRLHLEEDREVNVPDFGLITVTVNANLDFDRL